MVDRTQSDMTEELNRLIDCAREYSRKESMAHRSMLEQHRPRHSYPSLSPSDRTRSTLVTFIQPKTDVERRTRRVSPIGDRRGAPTDEPSPSPQSLPQAQHMEAPRRHESAFGWSVNDEMPMFESINAQSIQQRSFNVSVQNSVNSTAPMGGGYAATRSSITIS
jgi:hypothetical protein